MLAIRQDFPYGGSKKSSSCLLCRASLLSQENMLALVLPGAAAPQGPLNARALAAVERAGGPDGSLPLTRLRDLEPLYKSLEEIKKLFNKTMMSSPQESSFPASSCKSLTYGSTLATWDKMEYKGPQAGTQIVQNRLGTRSTRPLRQAPPRVLRDRHLGIHGLPCMGRCQPNVRRP
jgi:hypothetical protein